MVEDSTTLTEVAAPLGAPATLGGWSEGVRFPPALILPVDPSGAGTVDRGRAGEWPTTPGAGR